MLESPYYSLLLPSNSLHLATLYHQNLIQILHYSKFKVPQRTCFDSIPQDEDAATKSKISISFNVEVVLMLRNTLARTRPLSNYNEMIMSKIASCFKASSEWMAAEKYWLRQHRMLIHHRIIYYTRLSYDRTAKWNIHEGGWSLSDDWCWHIAVIVGSSSSGDDAGKMIWLNGSKVGRAIFMCRGYVCSQNIARKKKFVTDLICKTAIRIEIWNLGVEIFRAIKNEGWYLWNYAFKIAVCSTKDRSGGHSYHMKCGMDSSFYWLPVTDALRAEIQVYGAAMNLKLSVFIPHAWPNQLRWASIKHHFFDYPHNY